MKNIIAVLVLVLLILSLSMPATPVTADPLGLVSYWPAEGDADDAFGSNHGTLVNGAAFAPGRVGQAFSLDGVDDYVRIPDSASLDLTDAITIALWIKPESLPSKYANIISKGDPPYHSLHAPWQLTINQYNNLDVYRLKDDNYSGEYNVFYLPLGSWTFITVTFDRSLGKVRSYKNGEFVREWSKTNSLFTDDVDVTIGAQTWQGTQDWPGYYFDGLIDEVRIYNRALTDAEIKQLAEVSVPVQIDIKPGSDPNCFNNDGNGVIPVAILGGAEFEATQVDPETVRLEGVSVAAKGKGGRLLSSIEDVNGDGFDDLIVKIEDMDGTFASGSGTAVLTGALFDGTPIEGSDAICVVP